MQDYNIDAFERIAREQTTDEPMFFGIDECDHAHFWSLYDHSMIVVAPNLDVKTYAFADIECSTLSDWAEKIIEQRHGWQEGPNVADSHLDDGMAEALDV